MFIKLPRFRGLRTWTLGNISYLFYGVISWPGYYKTSSSWFTPPPPPPSYHLPIFLCQNSDGNHSFLPPSSSQVLHTYPLQAFMALLRYVPCPPLLEVRGKCAFSYFHVFLFFYKINIRLILFWLQHSLRFRKINVCLGYFGLKCYLSKFD